MLNSNSSSLSSADLNNADNANLQQRLGLYQVFLRLYEHNQGLLDEILSLENTGSKTLERVSLPYIQGLVLRQQIYLVTNILGSGTQSLTQSQNLWLIGRDSRRVNLPVQDKRLSRRHAAIRYANRRFYLVDLGSSNGTYINGEPIRRCTALQDGDRIRLGSLSFSFFICDFMKFPPQLSPEVIGPKETTQKPAAADEEEITTNLMPPPSSAEDNALAEDNSLADANAPLDDNPPSDDTYMFLRKHGL